MFVHIVFVFVLSLGLVFILCRKKQALTVEYALRNISIPIGVAEFITEIARRIEAELNSDGRDKLTA